MGFRTDLAKFRLGLYFPRQLPSIALAAMEEGFVSPSLHILAGMTEEDNPFSLQGYLESAMRELGMQLADERSARLLVVTGMARAILSGHILLIPGVREMTDIIRSGDFDKETLTGPFDGIGYSKIYKLYQELEEITDRYNAPANQDTEPDETLTSAMNALQDELQRWLDSMPYSQKY